MFDFDVHLSLQAKSFGSTDFVAMQWWVSNTILMSYRLCSLLHSCFSVQNAVFWGHISVRSRSADLKLTISVTQLRVTCDQFSLVNYKKAHLKQFCCIRPVLTCSPLFMLKWLYMSIYRLKH